jgi:SAM-dependent methyltransferase
MTATLYTRLLRWAFTRFYREFAWTYDLVAALVSRGLWRHWIEAVAPQLRGSRVLEIGCGTGYLQRALRRQGLDSYGLDASPQMLRLAQGKMERAGLSGDWYAVMRNICLFHLSILAMWSQPFQPSIFWHPKRCARFGVSYSPQVSCTGR